MGSARHGHIFEQLNRRLRNRMSGGVRGRGLVTPSYSILAEDLMFHLPHLKNGNSDLF